MQFDAILPAPFGALGVQQDGETLVRVEFAPANTPLLPPQTALQRELARQLQHYWQDGAFVFDLPFSLRGSEFQQRVWAAIAALPSGQVASYGDLARQIGSAARAVGGACGANPLPLLVPCHRVLAAGGKLGGFNAQRNGVDWLPVKRWLLRHEGVSFVG